MAQQSFSQIFQQNYNLKSVKNKSAQWFINEIRGLAGPHTRPNYLIPATQDSGNTGLSRTLTPGNFYLYIYDPEHKGTSWLPYWDTFPLCLPYGTWQKNGKTYFIGLNFHYLPPKARITLLDFMMRYATTKSLFLKRPTIRDNTTLDYNWQVIKASAAHPFGTATIKRYILRNVKSPFKKIDPQHWVDMMMLPSEQFTGTKTKHGAWIDSAAKAIKSARRNSRRGIP